MQFKLGQVLIAVVAVAVVSGVLSWKASEHNAEFHRLKSENTALSRENADLQRELDKCRDQLQHRGVPIGGGHGTVPTGSPAK